MGSPDISVVVPFYGSERHIGACIESLRAQRGFDRDYEIIMVDNGSGDASREIVQAYGDVTLLSETKPGAYAARNTGIEHATGSVIAFTDADCVVAEDWLGSIWSGLADRSVAVLVGRCDYPPSASIALHWLARYEAAKAEYVINRCSPAQRFAYGNNMAVRAAIFDEIGPFKEWRRAGDTELVHRLAERRPDLQLVYEPRMRVVHREFLSARARLRRLLLYRRTNSQIADFRELDTGNRMAVLRSLFGSGRDSRND